MNARNIIQLNHFKVEHLEIHCPVMGGGEGDQDSGMSIDYEVYENEEHKEASLLQLSIKYTGEVREGVRRTPDVAIQVVGVFRLPGEAGENTREHMVRVNGGMILYGMVRGHLAALTGLLSCGSHILPTVDWLEVVKDVESRRPGVPPDPEPRRKAVKRKAPPRRKPTRPER